MFNKGMGNIYKKAQQMQKKMAEVQEELKSTIVKGEAGSGIVKVTLNCKKDLLSIDIDESVFKEDKDMLEDLILVAIKHGMANADTKAEDMMKNVTGGMLPNLPGF